MLEVAPSAPPATPWTPPIIPSTSSALLYPSLGSPYLFPKMTTHVPIVIDYRHLHPKIRHPADTTRSGIPSPPEHVIPIPSELTDPSQDPPLAEQTMPPEETTTGEIEASIQSIPTFTTQPSSPHDPPTTI
ncbi:hypothetical protein AAG906_029759 [Vitis piasezkii]